jgi:hypothetical protein
MALLNFRPFLGPKAHGEPPNKEAENPTENTPLSASSPNGASEFILTAHMVPVVTTKHSPAERRERESEIMPPFTHFRDSDSRS